MLLVRRSQLQLQSGAAQTPVDVLPGDSTGAVGDTLSFNISGGTSPFTILNNNPSIATVTQNGGSFTAKLLNQVRLWLP